MVCPLGVATETEVGFRILKNSGSLEITTTACWRSGMDIMSVLFTLGRMFLKVILKVTAVPSRLSWNNGEKTWGVTTSSNIKAPSVAQSKQFPFVYSSNCSLVLKT